MNNKLNNLRDLLRGLWMLRTKTGRRAFKIVFEAEYGAPITWRLLFLNSLWRKRLFLILGVTIMFNLFFLDSDVLRIGAFVLWCYAVVSLCVQMGSNFAENRRRKAAKKRLFLTIDALQERTRGYDAPEIDAAISDSIRWSRHR